MALVILQKVYQKLERIAAKLDHQLPSLYFSVDSGFRSIDLVDYCEANQIIYIGVPKTTQSIGLNNKSLKVKDLKDEFIKKETAYYSKNGANPVSFNAVSFTWRLRVKLKSLERKVTLLFFRLNGSKKVSVIFSPNLDIKAKTLRRHWFERTKIELLFRMLKHNFKIQQTTVTNRLGFMKKLSFGFVKSVYAQLLVQVIKKTDPSLKRLGFEGIRKRLIFSHIGRDFLDELMEFRDLLHET